MRFRALLGVVAGAAVAGMAAAATAPLILSISPRDELIGDFGGSRPSVATDSLNQPHVVVDSAMSGSLRFFDRVGGVWSSTPISISSYNPPTATVFHPRIEIDENDRAWITGIMFTRLVEAGCGWASFMRLNMATAPSAPAFRKIHVTPIGWDPGNHSLDPGRPNDGIYHSWNGFWAQYTFDATQPGLLLRTATGQMFAGYGGEKVSFRISHAGNVAHPRSGSHGVWHAATHGYHLYDSAYQNSVRSEQNLAPVFFASYRSFPIMGGDFSYPGVCPDGKDPLVAFISGTFDSQGGIRVNAWNGTQMLASMYTMFVVNAAGTTGMGRYEAQMTPSLDGGVFITYSVGSRVKIRFVSIENGSIVLGDEVDIGPGISSTLCTDKNGDLHVVYQNGGRMWYSKVDLALSRSGAIVQPKDFDGDGKADLAVYDPPAGGWFIRRSSDALLMGGAAQNWGLSSDLPVPGDYNGDGTNDVAIWRPSTGEWATRDNPAHVFLGMEGDIAVPGDYDGDDHTDEAVYRPSAGAWMIRLSAGGSTSNNWGDVGDSIPVPGDYDGDGKMDRAFYKMSQGKWFVMRSSDGGSQGTQWGASTDTPVPGDYDGDGSTDVAIYRPSTGNWHIWRSTLGPLTIGWGGVGDRPVPGDYDGDGSTDVAVYRSRERKWYILSSATGHLMERAPVQWGAPGDEPMPGDYAGDGSSRIAIFRPSDGNWYIRNSPAVVVNWGAPGDKPVLADFDGNGTLDLTVFRPRTGNWHIRYSMFTGLTVNWGGPGDVTVAGQYNSSLADEIAVFRPANATWYVRGVGNVTWGAPTDLAVPADYDGDGTNDVAVFRPSDGNWYILKSSGGTATVAWGGPGDLPVPGDYDGDGEAEQAVFRPSEGRWYINVPGGRTVDMSEAGDRFAQADYDGDGQTDPASFNPVTGNWWIMLSSTGSLMTEPGAIHWGVSDGSRPIGAW